MSFSYRFFGTAGAVKKAIAGLAESATGVTKDEIVKSANIVGAVLDENVENASWPQHYDVQAAGHSHTENGEKKSGTMQVSVMPLTGGRVASE